MLISYNDQHTGVNQDRCGALPGSSLEGALTERKTGQYKAHGRRACKSLHLHLNQNPP